MQHLQFFLWFLVFSATLIALVLNLLALRRQATPFLRLHLPLLACFLTGILWRFLMQYTTVSGTRLPAGVFYPVKHTIDAVLLFFLMQLPDTALRHPSRIRSSLFLVIAFAFALGTFLWPGPIHSTQRSLTYLFTAGSGFLTLFTHRQRIPLGIQGRAFRIAAAVCAVTTLLAMTAMLLTPEPVRRVDFFLFLLFALAWDTNAFLLLNRSTQPAGSPPHPDSAPDCLSVREKEVFREILQGRRNAQIADRLFISPYTVKRHVASICEKCGVSTKLELLARYPARTRPDGIGTFGP